MTGRVIAWRVGLKVAVAAGPVLAVLASGLASALPPTWVWLLVATLASGHALLPESALGAGATLAVLAWWGLGGGSDASLPPALLLAATALVTSHVAAVVLAYGPPMRTLDRQLLRTWMTRAVLVVAPAAVVWGVAVVLDGRAELALAWEAGLVAAIAAAVATAASFRSSPAQPGGRAPSGRSRPGE